MKPCSPTRKRNKIAGNHDGSFVDVTLTHIVAVFSPSVIVMGLERRGRRFSPISKYTKCLLLCFFNQTQDNEGNIFFLKGGEEKILKNNTWFPLGVF